MKMNILHLLLGSELKQGRGVVYFFFYLLKWVLCCPPSPQHFTSNCDTEVSLEKSREQQHSLSTWHMGQHISHQGTAGVFWCVVMNSQPRTLSLFIPRWRDVHAPRKRSLELITGKKTWRSWDNKEGELDFSAWLFSTESSSYCLWCLYTLRNETWMLFALHSCFMVKLLNNCIFDHQNKKV